MIKKKSDYISYKIKREKGWIISYMNKNNQNKIKTRCIEREKILAVRTLWEEYRRRWWSSSACSRPRRRGRRASRPSSRPPLVAASRSASRTSPRIPSGSPSPVPTARSSSSGAGRRAPPRRPPSPRTPPPLPLPPSPSPPIHFNCFTKKQGKTKP